jgi:hypothetical protein
MAYRSLAALWALLLPVVAHAQMGPTALFAPNDVGAADAIDPMLFQISYSGEASEAPFALEGYLAITPPEEQDAKNPFDLTLVAGFPDAEHPDRVPSHGAIAVSTRPSLLGFESGEVATPTLGSPDPSGKRTIEVKKGTDTEPMGGWITQAAARPKSDPEPHLARVVSLTVTIRGDQIEGEVALIDEDGATYRARFKGHRMM